jgi:phospholipase C
VDRRVVQHSIRAHLVAATAVLRVRSSALAPRTYTVEPLRSMADSWPQAADYDLSVYGPNGFFRHFKGGLSAHRANLDAAATYDEKHNEISLEISNRSSRNVTVSVLDAYTKQRTWLSLRPGQAETETWSLQRGRGWYDLAITLDRDDQFEYRYAGHLETDEDSISDPLMGGLI